MNAGYVRLSRDDEKRNYISIENQKLIISQYAAGLGMEVERWYEDDGISGYSFNRPAFIQLMEDLDRDVDIVFAKDFSRIGRHNARVLLLLDEFLEREKRLIVVDDDYDSLKPENDIIGIKTWYNERYVKDTSKKIKRVLTARQKEGTLLTRVPFGYLRNETNKELIEIAPADAEQVKTIYNLYLNGSGYRRIAGWLNGKGIPTPSMVMRQRKLAAGKPSKYKAAAVWTDGMVKDILGNDFYIGIYRLHKRARSTIHGKDKRVPKEAQFIFENHHPPIIDKMTFDLVQELKSRRVRSNYRGSQVHNPFGSRLFCKDCGNRLTPIVRETTGGHRKYYICSTYNSKGKHHCAKAHLIEETDLINDLLIYIQLCRNVLFERIASYDKDELEAEKQFNRQQEQMLYTLLASRKKQLKTLLLQKTNDLSYRPDNEAVILESYDELQNEILAQIQELEKQLAKPSNIRPNTPDKKKNPQADFQDVIDHLIAQGTPDRKDIEILVKCIVVDENGLPEISLKCGLTGFLRHSPAARLNMQEHTIILTLLKLIFEEERGYTSVRYLSTKLTEAGFKKSVKSILPYLGFMIEKGILEPTEHPLKPYSIIISKEELSAYIQDFHSM